MTGLDYHTHTLYSDGTSTVEEMLEEASNVGLEQLAITDHYREIKDLNKYIREIRSLSGMYDVELIPGLELELNESLSLIRELGEEVPLIILSDHTGMFNPSKLEEMDSDAELVLGHPTLLEENHLQILEETGMAIELNERYRVPDKGIVVKCIDLGIRISLGSDAHTKQEVGRLKWVMRNLRMAEMESSRRAKILRI